MEEGVMVFWRCMFAVGEVVGCFGGVNSVFGVWF
jgi:hypothetical protein